MHPIIATLQSSGLGLVAEAVLAKGKDFVSQKTGVDLDKATLSEEDLSALKRFETEQAELRKPDAGQRPAARAAQPERKQRIDTADEATPVLNKIAGPVIAFSTILMTFLLFYLTLFAGFKPEQKEIILYILGVLSAISTQIFSYYFGSSQGSAAKSRTIDTMLEAQK